MPEDQSTMQHRSAGWSHWARKLAKAILVLFAIWWLLVLCALFAFRFVDPPTSMVMLGNRVEGVTLRHKWVPLSEISPNLRLAVISSEDGQFCEHWGVDWGAVREAIREASKGGEPRGASTIPMQTVKNLFMWTSRSYVRKVLEVPLAYLAVAILGRQRVLEIYLNIVEWGPGIFGAEAAAHAYFGGDAAALTRRQAALMAVALPDPSVRNPGRPGPLTRKLASVVERRMPIIASRTACAMPPRRLSGGGS